MAMNSDAAPKHGGSGGGELEKRMTAVETRLGIIEKTMVTADVFQRELGAVRAEIGGLRADTHGSIGGLRDETHSSIGTLRDELHVGLAAVRQEMRTEFGAVRQEMRTEFGAVRGEIVGLRGELRAEIAKIPFELVKWLIALAGIAAAIATTIYNIWFR